MLRVWCELVSKSNNCSFCSQKGGLGKKQKKAITKHTIAYI